MERVKRDHVLQLKKKDDKIRELTAKLSKGVRPRDEGLKSIVTRLSLRSKEPNTREVKTSSHRFMSPAPTAKKRSFWDITTTNSPSVTTVNGRKTRSYANAELIASPFILLQLAHPCIGSVLILGLHIANYIIQLGFTRQSLSPFRQ